MKKIYVGFLLIFITYIGVTAFGDKLENMSAIIQERHTQRLNAFIAELEQLKQFVNDGSTQQEEIQSRFLAVRSSFKKWEYLAEYNDPILVKDKINGAPLPKLERNSFGLNILQPRGMQILDELIFTEASSENKTEIVKQIDLLIETLKEVQFMSYPIYDRVVLEAARTEIVRVFTMGLTGFDVPGSDNAVNDAATVVKTIREDMILYKPMFDKTDSKTSGEVYALLDDCIRYLEQHNDFATLDRLHILKTYINPIYAGLLSLHKQSGIEMIHEVVQEHSLPPYNHLSENIFANDFLNYYKYIRLSKNLNSDSLRHLGKLLFFDPVLSSNLKRSCASCHKPEKAFTDGLAKSTALDFDGIVSRNSPTLINCVYSERFFHDMRSEALEDQIEHVLTSRKEFDTDMLKIISKLKESKEYNVLFDAAFADIPGEKINGQNISFAISAYVSSLRGFNSLFDKYVRNEIADISPTVKRGFNLFMGKAACGTCHFAPVFNGTVPPRYEESESEVLGVPENPYVKNPILDTDWGRGAARLKEQAPFNKYAFKTPTVRNIELTAPYMHNGSYKTLEDVMDFYNKGGGDGIGIKLEHQTLPFDSLSLNKQEIADIVSFMKALTDTAGMTSVPKSLPKFEKQTALNNRKVGGDY